MVPIALVDTLGSAFYFDCFCFAVGKIEYLKLGDVIKFFDMETIFQYLMLFLKLFLTNILIFNLYHYITKIDFVYY